MKVSGYYPHSSARYECQDGYKLKGNGYLKCLDDGTWNGSPPTCIRKLSCKMCVQSFMSNNSNNSIYLHTAATICPVLYAPAHGSVVATSRTPGSKANYECDEGYKLVGTAWRKCLDDCTWSFEEPLCKRKKREKI